MNSKPAKQKSQPTGFAGRREAITAPTVGYGNHRAWKTTASPKNHAAGDHSGLGSWGAR
jgi:hypothetical protein